jgi:hypothetical protein
VIQKALKHFVIKKDILKKKINEFVTYFGKRVIRNWGGHIHEINKGY